jgi:soluble lytic murein transglycosylase
MTADKPHGSVGRAFLRLAPLALIAIASDALADPLPKPNPGRDAPQAGAPAVADDPIGNLIDDVGKVIKDPKGAGSAPLKSLAESVSDGGLGLKLALDFLKADDVTDAMRTARTMSNPVDRRLVMWLVATGASTKASSAQISAAAAEVRDWPRQDTIRTVFEQALFREKPPTDVVIQALGNSRPISESGTLLLARAFAATGRKGDTSELIRRYWRDADMSVDTEKTIVSEFGDLLSRSDHKARLDRLLYAERTDPASRVAKLLDKPTQQLTDARIASIKRSRSAGKLLDAVPTSMRSDPGYTFAKVQYLRRSEKYSEAAKLLVGAPTDPALLVDPNAWSEERRLIARKIFDKGDAGTAYRLVAANSASERTERVTIEFEAGWYALRALNHPADAAVHFRNIKMASSMPLSQSRAEYWLARSAEQAGNQAEAIAQYRRAAAYPTTFYGQLAIVRLKGDRLSLTFPPPPSAEDKARFGRLELVQAIQRLEKLDRTQTADILYRYLADVLTDPTEMALLAAMAERRGAHQLALQIGKTATVRGIEAESLAFPTAAITPAMAKVTKVELPAVYAVARQESAFNTEAISSAGARGLLQLMPTTAKHTASSIGMPYNKARLTSDPTYNATLGAAHLAELVAAFNGSYAMSFAAYNAGASRVQQWIKAYGDPRDPKVDVVDWIERIPFSETRNYVQRTMENLQVYRAKLGSPKLRIESDLIGAGSG